MATSGLLFAAAGTRGAGKYVVEPVAEMKIKQLPPGRCTGGSRISHLAGEGAPAAPLEPGHGPRPWLAAEVAGKVWLFTLGAKGGSTPGGTRVAEIGPVPTITAPEYLLRINHGSGPPGSTTPVHTHPGSEAFYVVAGQLGQRTPHGVRHAEAGTTMNGHDADMPMEVFNSGTTDLDRSSCSWWMRQGRFRCRPSSSEPKFHAAGAARIAGIEGRG